MSPAASQLLYWTPLVVIAVLAIVRCTRIPLHEDEMADLWSTYSHHWHDDEGEAA